RSTFGPEATPEGATVVVVPPGPTMTVPVGGPPDRRPYVAGRSQPGARLAYEPFGADTTSADISPRRVDEMKPPCIVRSSSRITNCMLFVSPPAGTFIVNRTRSPARNWRRCVTLVRLDRYPRTLDPREP